jgi:hypothetical protein
VRKKEALAIIVICSLPKAITYKQIHSGSVVLKFYGGILRVP